MHTSKTRWLHLLSLRKGVVPLLVLLLALPAMGIASAALFDSSLVPWFATGGASDTASVGGDYALSGAAGMAGAHLTTSSGGDHTLYGGFVPAQESVPVGATGNVWLPIVAGEVD